MKYHVQILLISLLIVGALKGQFPAQTLPDFKFSRLNNSALDNNDLPHGKMLLFVFFDADCEHCQQAIQHIDQQYQSFKSTAMYLISLDGQFKINAFLNKYGPHLKMQKNVVLLKDLNNQFITAFKPYRYPAMFLYSSTKKLLDYEDNEGSVFRLVNAIVRNGK